MIVSELLKKVVTEFSRAGILNPLTDAQIIISHILGVEKHILTIDNGRVISEAEQRKITGLVNRRLKAEPVAYLTGRKEFYSLDFSVNRDVLIPRPETELLVDLVIYYARQEASVLDLCTGSGAIAVAVKHNRNDIEVTASDISAGALKIAKKNSRRILGVNKIKFFPGDLFEPFVNTRFDIIVSNPPYIDPEMIPQLQEDLSYEPEVALFCSDKGRSVIGRIIDDSKGYLSVEGMLIMEISEHMNDFIRQSGEKCGYTVSVMNDNSGHPRVAVMKPVN